jgi:hypothetical protein
MWAYVKNSQVVRLYSRPTALTIGGLQYPATIFSSWTASALKDIGIYSYSETGAGRTDYYTNSGPVYTVDDSAGTVTGTYTAAAKDLTAIKEKEVAAVKSQVASKLQPTDWLVVKASEVSGNTVPSVYATYRSDVRAKGNALETSVNSASDVDAIIALHTSTYHANGSINVLASMQDWPTEPDAPEDV